MLFTNEKVSVSCIFLIILQIFSFNVGNINSQVVNYNLSRTFFGLTLFEKIKLNTTGIKKIEPRIVEGEHAILKGNEHMVSIRLKSNDKVKFGSGHYCGGALISPNVVLTAAHCLLIPKTTVQWRPSDLITVMGILDRTDSKNSQSRDVSKVIVHSGFNMQTFVHDVGILILEEPYTLTTNVKTINFTTTGNDITPGRSVVLSGWGALYWEGPASNKLLTVKVNVVEHSKCKYAYRHINDITNGMFCAADGIKDSCQGDSGGPVVINDVVNGIVSWGNGCGLIDYPGVYTNVAVYKDWILKNSSSMFKLSQVLLVVLICFSVLMNIKF